MSLARLWRDQGEPQQRLPVGVADDEARAVVLNLQKGSAVLWMVRLF